MARSNSAGLTKNTLKRDVDLEGGSVVSIRYMIRAATVNFYVESPSQVGKAGSGGIRMRIVSARILSAF